MYYGNVTFVMCLPRSRSAWIASAFACGAATMHDPLKRCASINELGDKVDALLYSGSGPLIVADTAAALFYPRIAKRFPSARFLFVSRGVQAVANSLANAGQPMNIRALHTAAAYLVDALARANKERRFVHSVGFDQLSDPAELVRLWQFFGCTGPFPAEDFKTACETNVQVPFSVQRAQTDIGKVEQLMATRREGW